MTHVYTAIVNVHDIVSLCKYSTHGCRSRYPTSYRWIFVSASSRAHCIFLVILWDILSATVCLRRGVWSATGHRGSIHQHANSQNMCMMYTTCTCTCVYKVLEVYSTPIGGGEGRGRKGGGRERGRRERERRRVRDGKGERKRDREEREIRVLYIHVHVHVYTWILYIGRESGSDTVREETESGRNGAR